MTRGLILAADGFSESQLVYAYHRLREDAVLVDVASPDGGPIQGDRGLDQNSIPVEDLLPERRYDLVVIPGGDSPGGLADDDPTRRWLGDYLDAGGIVCAIGEGARLLISIDALDGRMATGPATLRDDLEAAGAIPTGEAVTIDGTIVTTRDSGALPFGIAAALGSVAIPQDPAAVAVERPHWGGTDAS